MEHKVEKVTVIEAESYSVRVTIFDKNKKIKVGDVINDGICLGLVEKFQRSGNWILINWGTVSDIYSTKTTYKHLRTGNWKIYKEVSVEKLDI